MGKEGGPAEREKGEELVHKYEKKLALKSKRATLAHTEVFFKLIFD